MGIRATEEISNIYIPLSQDLHNFVQEVEDCENNWAMQTKVNQRAEKNCEHCSQRPVESGTGQDQAEALDASWIIKINNKDWHEKFFLHSIEYAIGNL